MDKHKKPGRLAIMHIQTPRHRGTKSFSNGLFNKKDLTLSDALSNKKVESVPENLIIRAANGFQVCNRCNTSLKNKIIKKRLVCF